MNDKRLLEENELIQPVYKKHESKKVRYLFNRFLIWFVVLAIIFLRFTIAFAGAEPDYYTVDVVNPSGDIELGNVSANIINWEKTDLNKTTYHIDPNYNEMKLINDLKVPLNNSCEYYTVSWNIYSYL